MAACKLSQLRLNGQFVITVKVLKKSVKYPFKNGNGQLFSVLLADNSGYIDMKFFNRLVDVFYDEIEVSIKMLSFIWRYH